MKLPATSLSFLLAIGVAGCVSEDPKPDPGKSAVKTEKEATTAAMTSKTLELAKDP